MKLFLEQFAEHASSQPNKICLVDARGTLTYREVDELTNYLAQRLVDEGLSPGDSVAVFVSRSKEIMLGAIAIMKAGGVYLPIDEQYPNERIYFMLKDANSRFILLDRESSDLRGLKFDELTTVYFDEIKSLQNFESVLRTSDDSAMILYTSGTTGVPKGVIHRHALLANVNDWVANHDNLAFDETATMGIMTGFTFVATNVFMFGILSAGGTLNIAFDEVKYSNDSLFNYICKNKVTHTFMPSCLATNMIEDYDLEGVTLFAGGEALRNFSPKSSKSMLYNFYGSTELATVFTARVRGSETTIPAGFLTKGVRAIIVDEALREVASGEVGELLVSSPTMSLRYLNLEAVTAEKWIKVEGHTFFRTGDRASRGEDGQYYILGRIDNMVKLRGFRIETGEVEVQVANAIARHGLPDCSVIVALRTVNGVDRLCCYYESKQPFDSQKIREALAKHLPDYMIPELWMNVEKMPRNFNGKIKRDELPQPKLPVQVIGALNSEVELRVVEAVLLVLKLQGAIDPDDSFVSLGGNSLSAMELASALQEMGISVSASTILSAQSLRDIAKHAKVKYESLWSAQEYALVKQRFARRGEKIERVLPLTPQQDDLICYHLTHPEISDLEKDFLFETEKPISKLHLRSVLDEMTARHPEMRGAVVCKDVSVFQCVITDRQIPLDVLDKCDNVVDFMSEIHARHQQEKAFDLEESYMFRIVLAARDTGGSWVLVTANKIAYDIKVLRRLFLELMRGLMQFYPSDGELAAWNELLASAVEFDKEDVLRKIDMSETVSLEAESKDICIYSDKPKKKLFFVHTGNTGASAYYPLAEKIKNDYSFYVFEPYNLYHPSDIKSGISAIATKYLEIMKQYQESGPYVLGGWCYGGVVAHEMACQLQLAGEEVERLIMLDSHCLDDEKSKKLAAPMQASTDRRYFETCPLFRELREKGMLEAVIENSERVVHDLNTHKPKKFNGQVTYFKPSHCPEQARGEVLEYWNEMMKLQAGNYEKYCNPEKLEVIVVPGEHDTMMNGKALEIITSKILTGISI